jgi:endonuclease YncB( thermonuclease family)
MRRAAPLVAALVVVAAACNLPGSADPIPDESTTTSATIAVATTTTTEITLPPEEDTERGVVTEVIDGDTFVADVAGVSAEVRILGINAPEDDECFGGEARSVLTRLIDGSEVVLVAGLEDVDQFGRSLREVFIEGSDGTVSIAAEMVAEGMAVALSAPDAAAQQLKAIEGQAYASGNGMWATFACGQPEGGFPDRPQIRVSEVMADPEGPDEGALDGEWVDIVNEGYGNVSIAGWVIRDESASNRLILPAGTGLGVGESLRVVTGCGSSRPQTVYWCADGPVWSNDGDTVYLLDNLGNAVERFVVDAGPGA